MPATRDEHRLPNNEVYLRIGAGVLHVERSQCLCPCRENGRFSMCEAQTTLVYPPALRSNEVQQLMYELMMFIVHGSRIHV